MIANEDMARRIESQIARDYPDFLELWDLLSLARKTHVYGLGVIELSQLEPPVVEMIRMITNAG